MGPKRNIYLSLYWAKYKISLFFFLVCNMYEDKKTENWNNEFITQFIDTMHCRVYLLCNKSKTKTLCSQFCRSSFCWGYAADIFYSNYAGDNICCNYVGFEVLLQLCRWYLAVMLVNLSVAIMEVTVSVANKQLALMHVIVSAANMRVTIFIVIMQLGVCCSYTGGIFCSVLSHDWFYCKYVADCFCYSHAGDSSK